MKLYRMSITYSKQPWYNTNIYKLVEIHNDQRIRQFGINCTWEDIHTGRKYDTWDKVMKELTQDGCRDIKLGLMIDENI